MATPVLNYVSKPGYPEAGRMAFEKHGYSKGEICAMNEALLTHAEISPNFFVDTGSKLKGRSCKTYGSGLQIHIPSKAIYTYPAALPGIYDGVKFD